MRWAILLLLLFHLACAGSPLRITSVDRAGMPPYENTERLYRVAGEGWETLKPGDSLDLRRPGERRTLGRLEVVSLGTGFVQARLATPGETYALVGDLAVARDIRPLALPDWPDFDPNPLSPPTHLAPLETGGPPRLLERFFFLRGDSALSPSGQQRLKAWVQAHGKDGHWFLQMPSDPRQTEELVQARCKALKVQLEQLGVGSLELRKGPLEVHEKYDFITVGREP